MEIKIPLRQIQGMGETGGIIYSSLMFFPLTRVLILKMQGRQFRSRRQRAEYNASKDSPNFLAAQRVLVGSRSSAATLHHPFPARG